MRYAAAVAAILMTLISAGDSYAEQSGEFGSNRQPEGPRVNVAGTARVGALAPRFTVDAVVDGEIRRLSIKDYFGKWVVLFFYPYDFSIVCPTEIRGFNNSLKSFRDFDAEVLAISVDSTYSHLAWIKRGDLGDLRLPLLSDTTRRVTSAYGVLDPQTGVAFRGLFIIDPEGVIQYMVVHNMSVGRNVEETLRVLEALQSGGLCPLDWKKGQKTLE